MYSNGLLRGGLFAQFDRGVQRGQSRPAEPNNDRHRQDFQAHFTSNTVTGMRALMPGLLGTTLGRVHLQWKTSAMEDNVLVKVENL